MIRKQYGFTLIELMITMVIVVIIMGAAATIFSSLLGQVKTQGRIAETNAEGVVGLQMFKNDIDQAGYGLPWDLSGSNYNEVAGPVIINPGAAYNDDNGGFGSFPPRPIAVGYNLVNTLNNSDWLVIKANSVATTPTAHQWTYVTNTGVIDLLQIWNDANGNNIVQENLVKGNYVTVMQPLSDGSGNVRALALDTVGNKFYAKFDTDITKMPASMQPLNAASGIHTTYMIYGVDPSTPLRMPFNRADYYIATNLFPVPNPNLVPSKCAPNTGELVKSVVIQTGAPGAELPLLDCAADLQVVVGLDINNNGIIGTYYDGTNFGNAPADPLTENAKITDIQAVLNASAAAALTQRTQLKEMRVYILAHDGGIDMSFTYSNTKLNPNCIGAQQIFVGDASASLGNTVLGANYGRCFDLQANIGVNYMHYRWQVYSIVVKTSNLR